MDERTTEQSAEARLSQGQADALLEAEDLLLGTMESMRRVYEAPCPGVNEAQTCKVHFALLERSTVGCSVGMESSARCTSAHPQQAHTPLSNRPLPLETGAFHDKSQRLTRRTHVLQCLKPQQDA